MCVQYEPRLIVCVCVHLASRWSRIQIEPVSLEPPWYCYGDPLLSEENFNDLSEGSNRRKYVDSPLLECVLTAVERPQTTRLSVAENYTERNSDEISEKDSPLLKSVLPAVERPQATRLCLAENSSETNSGESSEKMSNHWLFTKEEIMNSPNMKLLADPEQELKIKIRASTLAQQIGEKLQVSTHGICIALVYVHRLYMHFNFEEVDPKLYTELEQELIGLESVILSILGNIELTKKAYFICTASIMATTICLQYEPKLVACVCVNLASRWSKIKIEPVSLGLPWYCYGDAFLTEGNINDLTNELGEKILQAAKYVTSSIPSRVMRDSVIDKPIKTLQTNNNDEKISILPNETSMNPVSKRA